MDPSNKRCGGCGERLFKRVSIKGRKFNWKHYKDITMTEDIKMWVCQNCQEIASTRGDAKKMDAALEKTLHGDKI